MSDRKPMKCYIEFVVVGVEGIEFVICAVVAGLLVTIGPPIWFYRLVAHHHAAMAAMVAVCWLGSVFAVVREVRNKAVTAVSLGVLLSWVVVLAYVFHGFLFHDSLL